MNVLVAGLVCSVLRKLAVGRAYAGLFYTPTQCLPTAFSVRSGRSSPFGDEEGSQFRVE